MSIVDIDGIEEISGLIVEYEGQRVSLSPDRVFDIGRDADLCLDNNPYLHRRFLRISFENEFWWLANIGTGLGATVHDQVTGLQAWLGPSSRLPVVFNRVEVVFTAGPCDYRVTLLNDEPRWQVAIPHIDSDGDTTVREIGWTQAQHLAVLALAEPMLLREGLGVARIPTNASAAARIGWPVKRFEKKIDNVCSKLDKLGVEGMRGGVHTHASGRRACLVEWAISTGFVSSADLKLLNTPVTINDKE
ncbi:MAG: hypothetical protein LBG99_03080 [Propionibacteriaceae bacterium]|jgi:hypothetical protein|nr:hypothetical protein [Propionibacteriaceae bacterium]